MPGNKQNNKKESAAETKKRISFAKYHTKTQDVYGGNQALNKITKHTSVSRRLLDISNKEALMDLIESSIDNPSQIAEVSNLLHSFDPNYSKIIEYYVNLFYIRYLVVPTAAKNTTLEEIKDEDYKKSYEKMMEVIDGMFLETTVTDLLEELFKTGSVYMTTTKNNVSQTATILMLPKSYCRTIYQTNFGTNAIQFDFRYFDQNFQGLETEEVLKLFPSEFSKLYNEYKNDSSGARESYWKILDTRYSTSIIVNSSEYAPFITALNGILEYETVRDNELKKSSNELKTILTHRIPMVDDRPIFDMDEVVSIQKAISKVTSNHEGLETITVFGPTEVVKLQEEGKAENKRINQSYNTIFNASGLNANSFNGSTDKALEYSFTAAKGFVWKFIEKISAYLNLTVNNIYNFKPLQAKIKFLPITMFDDLEQIKMYRENASYGIGKLEAIIATGVKQKEILATSKLEKFLDLESLLVPLSSSHTQSNTDSSIETAEPSNEEEVDT